MAGRGALNAEIGVRPSASELVQRGAIWQRRRLLPARFPVRPWALELMIQFEPWYFPVIRNVPTSVSGWQPGARSGSRQTVHASVAAAEKTWRSIM
jgi:hypothetical protein